ncbi:hypothetical protein GCM10027280_18010 [Micromonospora polyrhachis]
MGGRVGEASSPANAPTWNVSTSWLSAQLMGAYGSTCLAILWQTPAVGMNDADADADLGDSGPQPTVSDAATRNITIDAAADRRM